MSKALKAHLAVLLVNLIYGGNFTVAKLVMPEYIKPFGFILLRVAVTVILFFAISPFVKKEKIDRKDIPLFILCGLFGVAVNQMLFFKGLSMTNPINGAIIMTTNPILVILIAAVLIRERITAKKLTGIALGALGALALLFLQGKQISFSSDSFLGDVCIFINAMSYGIFLVISKPLLKKYHPLTMIKWAFVFGTFIVIPFSYSEFKAIPWEVFDMKLWSCIFYVVIGTTFVAYLLNTIALNTLSPSTVSTYIYLQPFIASLLALLIGNDKLTALHIISSLMIFAGVYLVSASPAESGGN